MNHSRPTWVAAVPVAVAVGSLLLNGFQYLGDRMDRRTAATRDSLSAVRARQLHAWETAPDLWFHYWAFLGTTSRICQFFTGDLSLSMDAMRATGVGPLQGSGAIQTLRSPGYDRMRSAFRGACDTKDPTKNRSKDWKFLLAINHYSARIRVMSVSYSSAHSDTGLGLILGPGEGVLVPLGVGIAGRPSENSSYDWVDSISITWDTPDGALKRSVLVRPPENRVVGYVMDATSGSPVFSEPPPVVH